MGTRGSKIVCVLFAAVIQKFEEQHCEVPGCKEEVWAACGAGSCLELMCYEHWMDGSAVHNLTCRGKSQPKCQPKTSECKVHILRHEASDAADILKSPPSAEARSIDLILEPNTTDNRTEFNFSSTTKGKILEIETQTQCLQFM